MSIISMQNKLADKLSGTICPGFLLYEEVTSTNDLLKDLIMGTNVSGMINRDMDICRDDLKEGFAVVSLSQSKGKGRSGRSFFSPPGCSLYFSVYLKPQIDIKDLGLITPMAASAVYDAVTSVCGAKCGIKWVNDLYIGNRKICGILTEASVKPGANSAEYVIIGIGINVFSPSCDIPADIKDVYGTIFDSSFSYDEDVLTNLISTVIGNIYRYYYDIENRSFLESYRDGLFIVGSEVSYMSGDEEFFVTVDGIDDDVNLLAHDQNGKNYRFRDGEVRLKILRK